MPEFFTIDARGIVPPMLERMPTQEAAHAVAGELLGWRVDSVTIDPHTDRGLRPGDAPRTPWASCGFDKAGRRALDRYLESNGAGRSDSARRRMEGRCRAYAIALLAGPVGTHIETGDFTLAAAIGSEDLATAGWFAMRLVTADTYDEAKRLRAAIIDEWAAEAHEILVRAWPTVEAIAAELRIRRTLPGAEVRRIISTARPTVYTRTLAAPA